MMGEERSTIMFVGMNCVDISMTCEGYPPEDTDNDCSDMRWIRGGNASNSCTALALLGGTAITAQYMGNLPNTYELQFFKDSFNEHGIGYADCPILNAECPKTVVLVNTNNGSRTMWSYHAGIPELSADDFKHNVDLTTGKYRWIHFEGRPNNENIEEMLRHVHQYNSTVSEHDRISVSLEIEKVRRAEATHLLKEVDVAFISKDYAMAKGYTNMEDAVNGAIQYCRPWASIVCAWGDKGAAAKSWDEDWCCSPAFPPEKLVNTTAAGDTFNAATILALTRGHTLHEAITFACKAAGAKCGMRAFENLHEYALP